MERVQKVMAMAGVASRRKCELLIEAGRVAINGRIAKLGDQVDPQQDRLELDGKPISEPERLVYLLLHKPPGVLSSSRSQGGHATILDYVQVEERVYSVGRLDMDSEGLILLTNDGELAHRLTHPRFEHEKEYRVLLDRRLTLADLKAWRAGPTVPSLGRLGPAEIEFDGEAGAWIKVTLTEGKKRQIRETAAHLGYEVKRLLRTRLGPQELGNLERGEFRHLTSDEVVRLRNHVQLRQHPAELP